MACDSCASESKRCNFERKELVEDLKSAKPLLTKDDANVPVCLSCKHPISAHNNAPSKTTDSKTVSSIADAFRQVNTFSPDSKNLLRSLQKRFSQPTDSSLSPTTTSQLYETNKEIVKKPSPPDWFKPKNDFPPELQQYVLKCPAAKSEKDNVQPWWTRLIKEHLSNLEDRKLDIVDRHKCRSISTAAQKLSLTWWVLESSKGEEQSAHKSSPVKRKDICWNLHMH